MRFASLLSAVLCAASLASALPSVEVIARQDTTSDSSSSSSASSASSASGNTTVPTTSSSGGSIGSPQRCEPLVASAKACTNPTVRKEWRTLSKSQKTSFLAAVKCLSHQPHNPSLTQTGSTPDIPPINPKTSFYDDMVYIHIDLNHRIHSTGWFFPWHRFYVAQYEKALRTKCSYTGPLPYWDWTQDTSNFLNATFWDSNLQSGVGTWGTPANDFQITDGAWGTSSPTGALNLNYPSPHAIRRNFTLQPYLNFPRPWLLTQPALYANETFTQAMVDKAVLHYDGDYKGFQKQFQDYQGPHAGVHLMVGADLTGLCPANASPDCIPGETWSPNDPLFFMHHARVDKVWYDWQHRNPAANKCAFEGGSVQMLDTLDEYNEYPLGAPPNLSLSSVFPTDNLLASNVHVQDVMDTTGGYLCYTYQ